MTPRPGDGFYVGYLPEAPPGVGRFIRRAAFGLIAGAVLLGLALAALQAPFGPGVFEYGVTRGFEGVVREHPYPTLWLDPPGLAALGDPTPAGLLLVAPGKHGAAPEVRGLDGRRARVAGALVYRDDRTLLQLAPGALAVAPGAAQPEPAAQDLGERTLAGEIVDSKCYLGVMKPGRGKPHRACASLCIRGGIPPVLVVESREGGYADFLLVDERGRPVGDRVLGFVGEPVEVTGRVHRQGDLLVLAADPATYRRLE